MEGILETIVIWKKQVLFTVIKSNFVIWTKIVDSFAQDTVVHFLQLKVVQLDHNSW